MIAPSVTPARPDALLPQGTAGRRWQEVAAQNAGIELDGWDPSLGFAANEDRVRKGYGFYQALQQQHPDLLWAGMAYGIAPTFVGPLQDLADVREGANAVRGRIEQLPAGFRDAARAAFQLSGAPVANAAASIEGQLLGMQRAIFLDMGMQHQAYVSDGMRAIRELRNEGTLDDHAYEAWRNIDAGTRSGDRALIEVGAKGLLEREQMQIIADDYDQMRERSHLSPVLTYAASAIARPAIPGSRSAADLDPVRVGPFKLPLPGIDVSRREQRWDMIERDTWPAYMRLVANAPEFQRMLTTPLDQRITDGKFRYLP